MTGQGDSGGRDMKEDVWEVYKEIIVFIALCAGVFGIAFFAIPQEQVSPAEKKAGSGRQDALPRSLPREERERLKQDLVAIEKNIAAQNKRGADTLAPQYVHMAGIYEALDLMPQARNAYIRAIEEDKKNLDALAGLGNVYVATERYTDAEEIYRTAITLNEKDPRGYLMLANFYFVHMDDEDAARTMYLRGLLATDNDASLMRAYAMFLENTFRSYEAYLYWTALAQANSADTEAKAHADALRPSVQDAIRAAEQGSKDPATRKKKR